MIVRSGELAVRCGIDFAAQSPWIFNGTVEENILFNRDLDKDKLDGVIRSCYLVKVLFSNSCLLPGPKGDKFHYQLYCSSTTLHLIQSFVGFRAAAPWSKHFSWGERGTAVRRAEGQG